MGTSKNKTETIKCKCLCPTHANPRRPNRTNSPPLASRCQKGRRAMLNAKTEMVLHTQICKNQIKQKPNLSVFSIRTRGKQEKTNGTHVKPTLLKEEGGGRSHHVGAHGMTPRRCILSSKPMLIDDPHITK